MKNFNDLGVRADLVKGIGELGIFEPTPIQEQAIPLLLDGNNDLVGQAQTGTGKTAAYGLPLLQKIKADRKYVQGLVLCPTRELGQQVAKQLFKFTKYTDKIFTEAVCGGKNVDDQIRALKRTTHIIVATPGRLIDMIKKKAIDLSSVNTVIMDEADEMLSLGFKKDIDTILGYTPQAKNKWLFSATMPEGIRQIVNEHLSAEAIRIEVDKKDLVNRKIKHQYLICGEEEKLGMLQRFLKDNEGERGVVFCRTKAATQKLAKQLQAKNIAVDAIHGDLLQKERDKVMRMFKNETLDVLVATDLAARGIDVQGLAFVVHYQLPDKDEFFTHRSGRTARGGREGVSIVLATSKEMKQVNFLAKSLRIDFEQVKRG